MSYTTFTFYFSFLFVVFRGMCGMSSGSVNVLRARGVGRGGRTNMAII